MKTKIAWCDHTVNPIKVKCPDSKWGYGYHCTKVSDGCQNCYAEAMNKRFGSGLPFDNREVEFYLDLSVFDTTMKKLPKKSCRVFVQSMGDLFHEDVSDDMIFSVLGTCAAAHTAHKHTLIILTKRPSRLLRSVNVLNNAQRETFAALHVGVSIEDQATADERIPLLIQTPSAHRIISIEPTLEEIDIFEYLNGGNTTRYHNIHQVFVGAESGPHKRYCDPAWIESIITQCKEAGVPCFVKQIHIGTPDKFKVSHDINEWPTALQVRQMGEE